MTGLHRLILRAARWLALARSLRRERATLAALPPHLLRDVGLDPGAARAEARRPFWSTPRARRAHPLPGKDTPCSPDSPAAARG